MLGRGREEGGQYQGVVGRQISPRGIVLTKCKGFSIVDCISINYKRQIWSGGCLDKHRRSLRCVIARWIYSKSHYWVFVISFPGSSWKHVRILLADPVAETLWLHKKNKQNQSENPTFSLVNHFLPKSSVATFDLHRASSQSFHNVPCHSLPASSYKKMPITN